MLDYIIEDTRRRAAEFAREIEYLREDAKDDIIDDRMSKVDPTFNYLTFEDKYEIKAIIESMPTNFDDEDDAEIERILESDHDLTFEELIGIE